MRTKILAILLCLVLAVSGCGMIQCMVSTEVVNQLGTGHVDICIVDYGTGSSALMPGDIVYENPRVRNDGDDCYIRTKVMVGAGGEGLTKQALSSVRIGGLSSKWVRRSDGYYYYTEVLKADETVDIFKWIMCSSDAPQDIVQGREFYLTVNVDAIQSKNFMPDFDAEQPWGTVEILKYKKEGQYNVNTVTQTESDAFHVVYEGKAGSLVSNKDDFFANFPYLMPGDVYSETAKLANNGENDIELFFRSEVMDESKLLDEIILKITSVIDGSETVIYEGTLRAEAVSENVSLGVISAGNEGNFNFEISVPPELNNEYTILSNNIKWVFSTEVDSDTSTNKSDEPGTGDDSPLVLYSATFAVSLIGLAAVFIYDRKQRKGGKV